MTKRYVGELYFILSNETIKYSDNKSLISAYREQVHNAGIGSVIAKVYNENNIDLRYEIEAIKYSEFGEVLPKKQFIVSTLTPEFNLQEKLKTIYEYEVWKNKKHRIVAEYPNSIYRLKEGILSNLSIKSIKNLVDRNYDKIISLNQGNNTPRKKHSDPER